MSTTRPLLGMRRVTELMCQEQPSSRLTAAAARQQLETPTVDEFTVLEEKENELKAAKPRVEQVFKVTFTIIGLLDHTRLPLGSQTSRQIWLQLIGNTGRRVEGKGSVVADAQVSLSVSGDWHLSLLFVTHQQMEYVRGLCDPELQKKRGTRWTCTVFLPGPGASSSTGSSGTPVLKWWCPSGPPASVGPGGTRSHGAEPGQQFEKRSLPSDREPAVKRAFKSFVEERDDKYTMELLLLPSALKEELRDWLTAPPPQTHLPWLSSTRRFTPTWWRRSRTARRAAPP
ncbi:hypothetical protein KUCAC02_020885 [Chaenocephalus aceratus]|uniref:Uncharacterized protein n=1 Tax=Chaenocephalus aceratus TaxID=36190 RepID=A0ACB9XFZ9_CHAAC|nr:hypothetical protein KUCAC02_020885 [Chaenocephalus aceratus]